MSVVPDEKFPDAHRGPYSKTVFGFWIYILTDFILFGTLFSAYAVLKKSVFGGTPAKDLFDLPYNLLQSLILLSTSAVVGAAGVFAHRKNLNKSIALFIITFILGALFLTLQFAEFARFIDSGNSWEKSAFLSVYFTLLGTHAAHISVGLLWIILLIIQMFRDGINPNVMGRITSTRMFWQFLNIIWVFIFTFVYLMGEI